MSEKPSKPTKPRGKPTPASKAKGDSHRGNPTYRPQRRKRPAAVSGEGVRTRRGLWFAVARVAMYCFILGGLALVYFAAQLPDIRSLNTIKKQQGITIEAADGHVVANYGDVYGEYIPYEQLPKPLVLAVIATEDRRFFEHHGVDFFGIARAMITNLRRGHMVQGGSTVTQQVAKNVFLTPDRTLKRKLQEVLLAFWLEARFSKKEIMAIYLNRVYLGAGTFGVDAASRRYFNKSARELNLYESALLAGLLKAPSRYSPAANTERAQARVHQVLLNMVDAGYLKEKDVKPTMANYAKSPSHTAEGGDVRYFTDWIVDELPNYVGQSEEDLIVTTTLDTKLQAEAQDVLQNVVTMQGAKKKVSQGALVSMKPDGAVQAVVGGLSYAQSQYNRATQAKRQPGSVFKLFVYLAALEAGLTPLSTVEDAPITLQVGNKTWTPDNYEQKFRGEIPMVEAIRYSLNTVSVRLSQYAGVSRVAQMAMRLGVPNIPNRPSIALGAVEATLLEMTGAYAHLPNGGKQVVPYGITRIRTREGKELYKHEALEGDPVLAKGTVEMMNYMLMDVATRGTGAKAALAGRQVAGKTGTSQDFKDAWFIGFTAQLVTGVWVGNDDNKPMAKVTGGSLPTTIWHDFMTKAMEGQPVASIPSSEGSSEGLLPWLFGGSSANPESTAAEGSPPPTAEGTSSPQSSMPLPANSPFRHAGDPALTAPAKPSEPVVDNSIPVEQPVSAPPSAPATGGASSSEEDVLTPQFWNKLMDKVPVPPKEKLEYSYPSDKHRR